MSSLPSALLVFVRAPEAGRVKTRLAAQVGDDAALRVYVRLAEHALAEARASGADVRVHYTPADAGEAVRSWLGPAADYLPQAEGGLGERLRRAFEEAFTAGYGRVVVVGSDLPGLSAGALRRAMGLLDAHGAVLGPAADGGYWLLGLRAPVEGVFEEIPWSTGEVLARTVERLRAAGIEPAMLETLADVDEAADLPPGWREWADG
ncbi:MAG TPA: TIGR04282 family arsenosugar biosynthesis glycosyltransferase [Longimicrobiaceae bacterium]